MGIGFGRALVLASGGVGEERSREHPARTSTRTALRVSALARHEVTVPWQRRWSWSHSSLSRRCADPVLVAVPVPRDHDLPDPDDPAAIGQPLRSFGGINASLASKGGHPPGGSHSPSPRMMSGPGATTTTPSMPSTSLCQRIDRSGSILKRCSPDAISRYSGVDWRPRYDSSAEASAKREPTADTIRAQKRAQRASGQPKSSGVDRPPQAGWRPRYDSNVRPWL